MRISQRGISLIKSFEGCLKPTGDGRITTYVCPAGVLTIGWGHTNHHGRQFKAGDVWTKQECDAELARDLRGFEEAVQRRVRVPLTQNQFDALVSFTYNCGEGNFAKSTLLRKLNAKDYEGAAAQFAMWNRGGGKELRGLTRRRAAEAALFRDGMDAPAEPMPQEVDPPRKEKPAVESTINWAAIGTFLSSLGAFLTDWRVAIAFVIVSGLLAAFIIWKRVEMPDITGWFKA